MPGRLGPIGVELLDELERVPHEGHATRQCDVEMVAARIGHVDAEQPVEADGLVHVLCDDADRGERRHFVTEIRRISSSMPPAVTYSR